MPFKFMWHSAIYCLNFSKPHTYRLVQEKCTEEIIKLIYQYNLLLSTIRLPLFMSSTNENKMNHLTKARQEIWWNLMFFCSVPVGLKVNFCYPSDMMKSSSQFRFQGNIWDGMVLKICRLSVPNKEETQLILYHLYHPAALREIIVLAFK